MKNKKVIAFSGSALLALGTMTPIVSLPIVGTINYFNNGQGDGVFILLIAVLAAALTWFGRIKFLWVLGGITLVLLSITLVKFMQVMNDAKSQLTQSLEGNPFAGLAQGLLGSIQLQWGWILLFAGAAALLVAPFQGKSRNGLIEAEKVEDLSS
jgi:hypothetical protein